MDGFNFCSKAETCFLGWMSDQKIKFNIQTTCELYSLKSETTEKSTKFDERTRHNLGNDPLIKLIITL